MIGLVMFQTEPRNFISKTDFLVFKISLEGNEILKPSLPKNYTNNLKIFGYVNLLLAKSVTHTDIYVDLT